MLHSQLFVGLLFPLGGFGRCRYQIVAPEMPDIDHAGFHRGVGKPRESNMCHFPASTILLLTLCQWFRTLYNTQKAIQENQDATIDAFAVICGPIIPTGRLWLLQDIMLVLIGAPKNAGYRWCRLPISASTILTPLFLDVVGYPPRGNRRHCALYAGSSTYAGLIRGYMDVTLSHAHNMPEALCMPD